LDEIVVVFGLVGFLLVLWGVVFDVLWYGVVLVGVVGEDVGVFGYGGVFYLYLELVVV
jgi:hypothetical protein